MQSNQRTWISVTVVAALSVAISCSDSPPAPSGATESELAVGTVTDRQQSGATIPFSKLKLFFEFNATDNDLGVQLLLDGEDWQRVEGSDPRGREFVEVEPGGRLRQLGLTELFFESAEPSPEEVLRLIPAGTYTFSGKTVDGQRLAGTATLSHSLSPAPSFSPSNGELVDVTNAVITWQPIAGLAGFQVIVIDETLGLEMTVDLAAAVTSVQVPVSFLRRDTQYKAEVLAIGTNGNKTISEGTFRTKP